VTFTFTGTGLDIFWAQTSSTGTFSYAIDGGATTNVNTNGTPNGGGHRTIVRGLTSEAHSVVCTYVSGGWLSGDLINGTRTTTLDPISTIQPSLVGLCLVLNDYAGSVTSATFKRNMQTLITSVKAKCTKPPTILIITEPGRGDTTSLLEPYPNYVDKLYEIAASDPTVMMLDLYRRLGITPATGIENTTSGGLIVTDKVHFSDFGAQWAADVIAAIASPS
jgi:hypothetical protein